MSRRTAPVRLFGMFVCVAAGTWIGARAGGWSAGARSDWWGAAMGADWWGAAAGVLGGYLFAHTVGWGLDRFRDRPARRVGPPTGAQRYQMRTTTLSGSLVAGLGFGVLGMVTLAGTFGLIGNAVARRFALGAPILFVAGLLALVVGGVFWLRRAVLSDVEVVLGTETLVLRARRRKQPWQEIRLPLSRIRGVTRFADPFGPGRWLRVDAGEFGRFELRASGVLAGRRAQAAIGRLGIDLLDRLGVERGTRPYVARWGTTRYDVRKNHVL